MYLLSHMLTAFVQVGELTVIDVSGHRHLFGGRSPGPDVTMQISDPALYRKLVLNPELAAGEGYMDGRMSFPGHGTNSEGLRRFLTLFSMNRLALGSYPLQRVARPISRALKRLQQSNRVGEAQRNVAHHYDLGNEFYRLFLDDGMFYSCGYYKSESDTLEQAQQNKCRLIAAKLQLSPGMTVLDIGCGWGGLAIYLAKIADVQVIGCTLSKEQHAMALHRAKAAGVDSKVQFLLMDYRNLDRKFDRIVSVGMFEHVGVHHYDEFFAKVNQLLPDNGLMLLHSIGHMSPPGTASPWLRKWIFPGAYSPALSEVLRAVEMNSLWMTDLELLRVHYARTLHHWHERFEHNREHVAKMYDERFCRMWEFYLISAEMMFRTGSQLVFHMQLSRQRDAAPIVRDYITDTQREYLRAEVLGQAR
jgi:cyclopropane-fatty-acyl-phospholipid synthase